MVKPERPDVVVVIPAYERRPMLEETIAYLRQQRGVTLEIVIVGSGAPEAVVARKMGCHYVEYPNEPLSSKWQAGIWLAGDIYPTAVLILGSDTFLSPDWCRAGLKAMRTRNADVVGTNRIYGLHLTSSLELVEATYHGERRSRPCGVGRMISREGMKAMDWVLFKERKSRHCDSIAWRAIRAAGLKSAVIRRETALTFKCDRWADKHTWDDFVNSIGLDVRPVENASRWLDHHFPGTMQAVERLRRS